MRSEWPIVNLGEYCSKIGSGSTPKGGKNVYSDTGITSLIRSQNIYNDGFTPNGIVYISEDEAKRLKSVEVLEKDILINITGDSVARVCLAPKDYLPARVNQHVMIIRVNQEIFDHRFLRYWLASPEIQNLLLTIAGSGATRNALTKANIENLTPPAPSLPTQKLISDILESLDEKIANNQKINQTLEEMAQAIFKSWFVDFDPVKAKAQVIAQGGSEQDANLAAMQIISGKTRDQLAALEKTHPEHYTQLHTTASLFPSAFVDSELGEIPEGWEVCSYKDICVRIESGGTPKRSEESYWNGEIKWLSSGEVREKIVIDTKETISKQGLDNSTAKLWPKLATVIAMYGATAGEVCLLATEMAANQACCALIPKPEFTAFAFISAQYESSRLAEKASGSAQQNLNKGLIENHQVLAPCFSIANRFESIVAPLLQQTIASYETNNIYKNIRDNLLPKLLSGEIDISQLHLND